MARKHFEFAKRFGVVVVNILLVDLATRSNGHKMCCQTMAKKKTKKGKNQTLKVMTNMAPLWVVMVA